MDEFKKRAKDEIKKGIAEVLEELGAEIEGNDALDNENEDSCVKGNVSGILNSLRRGMCNHPRGDYHSGGKSDNLINSETWNFTVDTDDSEIHWPVSEDLFYVQKNEDSCAQGNVSGILNSLRLGIENYTKRHFHGNERSENALKPSLYGDVKPDESLDLFEEDNIRAEDRFRDMKGLKDEVVSDMEVPSEISNKVDVKARRRKESGTEDVWDTDGPPEDEEPKKGIDEEDDRTDEINSEEESTEKVNGILDRLREGLKDRTVDVDYGISGFTTMGRFPMVWPVGQVHGGPGLFGGPQGMYIGSFSDLQSSGGAGSGDSGKESDEERGKGIESYVFEDVSQEEATDLPETGWEGSFSVVTPDPDEPEKNRRDVNEYYCLVPKNPEPGEDIYTYAHIYWDSGKNSLVYSVVEPKLSEEDKELLDEIKENIEERLDVNFDDVGKIKARGYISDRLDEALEVLGEELSEEKRKTIRYYLERDYIDMGKIEPLMRDPNIEEISCDGVGIPIFVYHRNAKYGSMETNVVFEDDEKLDMYVRRLGQTVGKTVSMANPLVDASLPDGSRLQATLGTDIARKGSNFTIRKFTENPLTPVDLIEFGTVDPRVLAYLWLAIENENSVLISGGTATGKTTMLNVISLFIRPEMKIVTIEDTAELRLPHDHWVPEVAREAIAKEGSDTVDMFKLLKESLRQRPDYIVVGEVRGAEAFVLFQQMSTGHPGLATIHAENPERLVSRLTTKPIDLPPSLLSALDIVIFLRKVRVGDTLQRKIDQVVEIKRFSREENVPKMNRVFKWDASEDKLVNENPSLILKEVSRIKGKDEEELKNEVKDRETVIEWMIHESVRNLEDIGSVLSRYYSDKRSLMEKIDSTR